MPMNRTQFPKTVGQFKAGILKHYTPGYPELLQNAPVEFDTQIAQAFAALSSLAGRGAKRPFCVELARLVNYVLLPDPPNGSDNAFDAANEILDWAGLVPNPAPPNLIKPMFYANVAYKAHFGNLANFLQAHWH